MITRETRVKKNEKIPWRIIEEEGVLVDVRKGEVIHLNQTAASVWNHIDGEKTVGQLIDAVCEDYVVDAQSAQADVIELLDSLLEKGIIEGSNDKN